MKIKKICSLLLSLIMLLALFPGCEQDNNPQIETEVSQNVTDDEPIELWVVTEKSVIDGMNLQARLLKAEFEKLHENVTIKIEILPTDAEKRELRIQALRVEILAGNGPDIYLLPVSNYIKADIPPESNKTIWIEKLIQDEMLAMYNGHFTDISAYYDADETLGKEGLVTKVMDAGVVDGARYILPLRYNIPLLIADTERLKEFNVDQERLYSGNIMDLMDLAIETEDQRLAGCAVPRLYQNGLPLSYLSNAINYENGDVELSEEELTEFLEKLRLVKRLTKGDSSYINSISVQGYLYYGRTMGSRIYPMAHVLLEGAAEALSVCQVDDIDATVIPIRATDGALVADITYYGAVGSSCKRPDLAYEYLRLFLLEESQWEMNRKLEGKDSLRSTDGLIAEGWPVRAYGAVDHLESSGFRASSSWAKYDPTLRQRWRDLADADITEQQFAFLNVEIDRVRFRLPLEWEARSLIASLSDEKGYPSDVDVNEVSEEIIYMLELHVAEG